MQWLPTLAFDTPGPEHSVDSMWQDKFTRFAERRPVSLAGTLDRAVDDMPGDEGEDNEMPPCGHVLLRD